MKMSESFELVNVADEHLAIPVGNKAGSFKGLVVLDDASAFLLSNMQQSLEIEDLVNLLVKNYDVDREKAYLDIKKMLDKLMKIGLVSD